jgi:hypothetical protein
MTSTESASVGRAGQVLRVLPHGTVMIWDPVQERAYPFYKAGLVVYRARERVRFTTDATDTFVISVTKSEPPSLHKRVAEFANRSAGLAGRRSVG